MWTVGICEKKLAADADDFPVVVSVVDRRFVIGEHKCRMAAIW